MKILFVSESVWMVGVVYDLHILAEGLSLLGHEVYAIDPGVQTEEKHIDISKNEFQKVSRAFPEATVNLVSPRLPKPTLFNFNIDFLHAFTLINRYRRLYLEIEEVLKNNKIDIIVLYSAVRSGRQTVLLARKYKIPVVFRNVDMLHKLWPTRIGRFVAKILERNVYTKMDKLLALTPKYADYLINLGAKKSKVDLLLFPIEIEVFRPKIDCSSIMQKWKIEPSDKVIVFMATLYKFGGIVEFAKQFPLVLKEIPEAKLLIVGDGPVRPELEDIISELDISDSITITGYQPFNLMPQFINTATLCLNVFPINDTTKNLFSAKIIQYLSCKKATVSSSLPGITTLITGEACGVVYSDTIEGLVKELVSLIKAPKKCQQLGKVGRDYVKQFHGHDKIILRLEEILKNTKRK